MSGRILHIIDSLARTGSAAQLLLISQGLARAGFDVHVLMLSRDRSMAAAFESANIPVTAVARRWAIDPLADWRLRQQVARLRPDILHTWNAAPGMFGAIPLGRPREAGDRPARPRLVAGRDRIDANRQSWEWFLERRLARYADVYVVNTAAVRDWCLAHGLPAAKFTIISRGAPSRGHNCGAAGVSRAELLGELGLPPESRLIGVVGSLVPKKHVQDLIWAADLLRVLHDNMRLLVIGGGPLRAQLERYARLASDLEHIHFLGERADLARIMPHMDVLWNGSERESQSAAILEAMAAGVPVIASDIPANRELVIEGETGYLVPLGSRAGRAPRARHTDRIFTDAELAARLGAAASHRAKQCFPDDECVRRHIAMYERLMDG